MEIWHILLVTSGIKSGQIWTVEEEIVSRLPREMSSEF